MKVTIKDIAIDAGVSVSTVSRVMNGTKTVSEDLKQRVKNSIQKFNFKPDAAARSLVTKNTGLVAVLAADVKNPITAIHLKQISEICMRNDKVVIVCDYDFDCRKALRLLDNMKERNIDGLIFQGVQLNDEILEKLEKFDCPVVLGNQGLPENVESIFTSVTVDSYHAMRDVTDFFIKEGHKKIAYIGGSKDDYTNGVLRLNGFMDAMLEQKLSVPDVYVFQGTFSMETGVEGMKSIYNSENGCPTAIVTGSDVIAVGVIRFLKSQGIRIPDDVSVMGFDDSLVDIYGPLLSTVRMFDQGEIFYDALFGDTKEKRRYFPYQIIRRSTTKNNENKKSL